MTVELKKYKEQVFNEPFNHFLYSLNDPEYKIQYPLDWMFFLII